MMASICAFTVSLQILVCSAPKPEGQLLEAYHQAEDAFVTAEHKGETQTMSAPMLVTDEDPNWVLVLSSRRPSDP